MRRIALLGLMLLPRLGFATDLGPPAAGFDSGGFTLRATLKGTSSQYSLQRDDRPAEDPGFRTSFATGSVEGAFGVQDRVRVIAHYGIGGFNDYSTPGAPDGTYKVYGGGARVTVMRLKNAPIEIGGGLSLAWWERDAAIFAGEWTVLAGGALRIVPGHVVYGGAQYYTVGGTQSVIAEIEGVEVGVNGEAAALYGGYEMRLAILSARIEFRAEAPVFHRTGFGLSVGMEF